MAQLLNFRPEFERENQPGVELGTGDAARTFRIVTEWSRVDCAWFMSVYESDGRAIVENARVSPGMMVLQDIDRLDGTKPKTAFIYVLGPEPYAQLDLGVTVKVLYGTYAEFTTVAVGDGTAFVVA